MIDPLFHLAPTLYHLAITFSVKLNLHMYRFIFDYRSHTKATSGNQFMRKCCENIFYMMKGYTIEPIVYYMVEIDRL